MTCSREHTIIELTARIACKKKNLYVDYSRQVTFSIQYPSCSDVAVIPRLENRETHQLTIKRTVSRFTCFPPFRKPGSTGSRKPLPNTDVHNKKMIRLVKSTTVLLPSSAELNPLSVSNVDTGCTSTGYDVF